MGQAVSRVILACGGAKGIMAVGDGVEVLLTSTGRGAEGLLKDAGKGIWIVGVGVAVGCIVLSMKKMSCQQSISDTEKR